VDAGKYISIIECKELWER